jgi:hypothetical protein
MKPPGVAEAMDDDPHSGTVAAARPARGRSTRRRLITELGQHVNAQTLRVELAALRKFHDFHHDWLSPLISAALELREVAHLTEGFSHSLDMFGIHIVF